MKTIANYIFLWAVLLPLVLIQTSCVEDVKDADIPSIDPKLVVFSYLSPNDSVRVYVWKSTPVVYNKPIKVEDNNDWWGTAPQLTDAIVHIMCVETQLELPLFYSSQSDSYILSPDEFPVRQGFTYQLRASAPNLKPVTASLTVPQTVPQIKNIRLRNLGSTSQWSENYVNFRLTGLVADPSNSENFYRVGFEISNEYCYVNMWYDWENKLEVIDTICNQNSSQMYSFFSDKGRDGEDIGFRVDLSYDTYQYNSGVIDSANISISVRNSDVHYHKYLQSFESYMNSSVNPFAEAAPLYTNIVDGLGIFCSYVDTTITKRVGLNTE